ncbi:biotin transporter BioY [Hasllibacter halocynthiae]|nr:biotin transporter BioY [Hasllibacter halocynthiae]
MTDTVLIERIGPAEGRALWAKRAAAVALGVAILATSAKISVPMWPVPITMGTFAVLTLGAAYGPRLGLATILLYMAVGAAGVPLFAGESAGLAYMLGGTGGYLLGYVLATVALGLAARAGWDRSTGGMAAALLAGNALIYVPGLIWLNQMPYAEGWSWTLAAGLTPFLLGDAIKLVLAALLIPAAWKLLGSARG